MSKLEDKANHSHHLQVKGELKTFELSPEKSDMFASESSPDDTNDEIAKRKFENAELCEVEE